MAEIVFGSNLWKIEINFYLNSPEINFFRNSICYNFIQNKIIVDIFDDWFVDRMYFLQISHRLRICHSYSDRINPNRNMVARYSRMATFAKKWRWIWNRAVTHGCCTLLHETKSHFLFIHLRIHNIIRDFLTFYGHSLTLRILL